jgi:transposase-like protein
VVFGAVVCQALSARPENKEVLGTAVGDTECIRTSQATASLKLALGALGGVSLVVSDHHQGLGGCHRPLSLVGPGSAVWVHFMRNALGPRFLGLTPRWLLV